MMAVAADLKPPPVGVCCPVCGHPQTRALYTRRRPFVSARVRQCKKCKAKFWTSEKVVRLVPPVG